MEQQLGIHLERVVVRTQGDRDQATALHDLGGQGVFVKEVQTRVLSGEADFAVHSAKDVPAQVVEGLCIASIPDRQDPRDCLVGGSLDTLGPAALVLTGSVRREAQLKLARPDLRFGALRGNIETRLAKVPEQGAIVVAAAALARLGLLDLASEFLPVDDFVPQVGQGALILECKVDDLPTSDILSRINHAEVNTCVSAERAVLSALGAGCEMPVGAHAVMRDGEIFLSGFLFEDKAGVPWVAQGASYGVDPEELGHELGLGLLAHLRDQT